MAQGILYSDQKRLWTTALEKRFSCKLTSSPHTVCHFWFPENAYIIDISEVKDLVSYVQHVTAAHVLTLSHARNIFWSLWESWRLYSWLACTNEIFLFILAAWNTSRWRLWPVGLESFVYCLFRSQLAVAIATEAHTMICGIVRFEYQLQSVLKESIIAWLLSITVGDSCAEWVQNPNYRCLGEDAAGLSTSPSQMSFLSRWCSAFIECQWHLIDLFLL